MSIRARRNSVRKSAISIDGIRNSVRAFNRGINTARNISNEILETTRNRNRFKQTLTSKDNEYFRRRQENIKRKQREDELEAQDVKKLPKTRGNLITRSTRGLLGRLLDFLGVLLVGFVINNLPAIQKAITSIIEKIKKVVEILDPFIKGIQFFLEGISRVLDSILGIFAKFDFTKDKKSIEESVEKANNNILQLNSDFIVAANEFQDDENIKKVPEILDMMDDIEDVDVDAQSTISPENITTEPSETQPEERAMGGPVMKNESYIVGEEGPELFIPDQAGDIVTDEQLEELQAMIERDDEVKGVKNDTEVSETRDMGDRDNEVEGVRNESEIGELSKVKPQKVGDGTGILPTPPEKEESTTSVMRGRRNRRGAIRSVNKDVNVDSITPVRKTRSSMVGRRRRKTTVMIVEKPAQQGSNPSMVGSSGQGSTIIQGDSKSDVLSSLQGLQLKKN